MYVKSIKSFEVRREKNFITLPCAKKTHVKFIILPCKKNTWQIYCFTVCPIFTVCFLDDTQQNSCLPCARDVAHNKLWARGKYAISRSDACK